MLGEVITTRLVLALGMVGLGMIMVNYRSAKNIPLHVQKSQPSR
jgi:hypothetical protein